MADTKITGLTANTAPILTDIMPMVDDPGGSPVTQKITIQNLRRQLFPYGICGGRLTLTTGTAVTTADVTAAGTLYFTPYSAAPGCGQVGLYDGSAGWDVLNFTELSLSLAAYTASKPYDIWIYNNSGTAALESTIWTNATTRATALALQDGVYVKTGATTRRYLGTIYINASGAQTDDALAKRNVFNYYNRRQRRLYRTEATLHNYNTAAYRAWNNDTTQIVEVMVGVVEDTIALSLRTKIDAAGSGNPAVAVSWDGATALDTNLPNAGIQNTLSPVLSSSAIALPALGYHTISVIETSISGAATTTFENYFLDGAVLA